MMAMYVEHRVAGGEATLQERRAPKQDDALILGHVVQRNGARAFINAYAEGGASGAIVLWVFR